MARLSRTSLAAGAGLAALLLAPAPALTAGGLPSLDAPELARGPYSSMHMLLQKTVLKINVATVDVRFDRPTQSKLAELATGKPYSYALDAQLAQAAIGAARAVVQMQFVRDVPLNRWLGVVRDNLELAREAGLIGRDIEEKVSSGIPQWFAPLADRGYKKGDRLVYAVTPDTLRTVVLSASGQLLLDLSEHEAGARKVVLASYFAPKSDTRELLIRSLWEGR
ncbi:MAG TPA: hypothetical protein VHO06_22185 [Polyangia bacterium]|nr:hypothetical protein [Polyangia bacterium]